MNKRTFLLALSVVALIFFVYWPWFASGAIIGGDWPYFWRETLSQMRLWPSLWAPWQANGLGGVNPLLGLQLFQSLLIIPFVNWLGLPWEMVYKIGWFGLFIVLSIIGSKKLWEAVDNRQQTTDSRQQNTYSFPWWIIASLVYTTNTYILMVTGGGQMGVALAYSVTPLVLASFVRLIEGVYRFDGKIKNQKSKIKNILYAGLILGFQLMIDPRIAYVTMGAVGLYYMVTWLHCYMVEKKNIIQLFYSTVIPVGAAVIVAALLNAFWLLPMAVIRNNPFESLGSAYISLESLKFFSFADFSHALSLLHPNWPENLFGKTYFLQPEYLVLPILAFASLLFFNTSKSKSIRSFAFVALLGAFLSKGANPPFGIVYVWFYEHVPGFVMFRDPTKFYVMIATAYAVLIPFTLDSLTHYMRKLKRVHAWVLPVIFLLSWTILIRPAVTGVLGGTFAARTVPASYVKLKEWMAQERGFFRSVWVPRQSRFAYSSPFQTPLEADPLFGATDAASLTRVMNKEETQQRLDYLAVRYVVLPFDPYGEIFQEDRRYSDKKRKDMETVLDTVSWLTKVQTGDIAVYKTPAAKDHFWLEDGTISGMRRISDGYYEVDVITTKPTKLMVSESYHPGWQGRDDRRMTLVSQEPFGIMSFALPQMGSYTTVVEFAPRRWFMLGRTLSLGTLGMILVYLMLARLYGRKTG